MPESVLNFVGRVLSWVSWVWGNRANVGISWVQNFFSWLFCRSKIFSRVFLGSEFFSLGYFMGPNFRVGVSWFQNFLVDIRGSEFFFGGYFVGQNFFLVSILWPHCFSCGWFRDSKILSCWLHEEERQKIHLKPRILF